jgi:hypothetical protein
MPREQLPHEPGDETIDRLLAMSSEPPQLEPDARDRLLARLQASRSAELTPPAATRGTKAPMNSATPPPPAPPSRLRVPGYALALAASGLLVWGATSTGLFSGTGPDAPVPEDSIADAASLRNDDARPRQVTLADGSTALLRQGAALRQDGPRRAPPPAAARPCSRSPRRAPLHRHQRRRPGRPSSAPSSSCARRPPASSWPASCAASSSLVGAGEADPSSR